MSLASNVMAIVEIDGKQIEVANGAPIMNACIELEVPFSCMSGTCGSCIVRVLDGGEKLGPLNEKEIDFGIDEASKRRLACQCSISDGHLVLKEGY